MNSEPKQAIQIANRILDVPNADPDRDEAIVARQFVRLVSALENILPNVTQVFDGWHNDGTAWSEWDESIRKQVGEILTTWCFARDPRQAVYYYDPRITGEPSGAGD